MSAEIIRIYGRCGSMPELQLEELDSADGNPRYHLDALARRLGKKWRVWVERLPRVHPAKRSQVIRHHRPKAHLDAYEGLTGDWESGKQAFNPAGPAISLKGAAT